MLRRKALLAREECSVELVMRKTENGWKWVTSDFKVSEFRGCKESGETTRLGDRGKNPRS